jgi:Tfp pilus assembly protein PilX
MLSWERIAARLRDESGISLIIALGMTLVLSLTTVGVVQYTSSGSRTSSISRSYVIAQSLAEAGLNNAQARLADPANNALTPSLLTPTSGGVTCPDAVNTCFQDAYEGGTVQWFGSFNSTTNVWTITSWGLTTNPTDPTQTIRRRMLATTPVVADSTQVANATAWNYVLATKTSNSTTCDTWINENVVSDVSFYVAGNLCVDNNGYVLEPDHAKPVTVTVLGKLKISNNGAVGQSTSTITNANVGGGCVGDIRDSGHPCTTSDNFWVQNYSQSPTMISVPVPDYSGWYSSAKPGPAYACTTSSGSPPVWDSTYPGLDLNTNGSQGTFNLTPATSYSCKYVQNGTTVGELTWAAATKTLTVKGAMYFDGSMSISGATITYNGSATIYLTGTLSFANDTRFCAVNSGTTCDFSTWNPGSEMLIFVVNGLSGAYGVEVAKGTLFQGGIQSKNSIHLNENTQLEGPLIASGFTFDQNVVLKPLPQITQLPLGAPGNNNTHASPTAPTYG